MIFQLKKHYLIYIKMFKKTNSTNFTIAKYLSSFLFHSFSFHFFFHCLLLFTYIFYQQCFQNCQENRKKQRGFERRLNFLFYQEVSYKGGKKEKKRTVGFLILLFFHTIVTNDLIHVRKVQKISKNRMMKKNKLKRKTISQKGHIAFNSTPTKEKK